MLAVPAEAVSRLMRMSLGRLPPSRRPRAPYELRSTALVSVVAVSLAVACGGPSPPPAGSPRAASESAPTPTALPSTPERFEPGSAAGEYVVVGVADGDTIDVRPAGGGRRVRVRLIGVDAPESKDPRRPVECFAEEASRFTARLLGKLVRLEFDVEHLDRYGRTLAYVYLSDGTFFNLVLVEEGFAQPYTVPPNVRYADRFVEAGRRAREAGRGLWGRCGSETNPSAAGRKS